MILLVHPTDGSSTFGRKAIVSEATRCFAHKRIHQLLGSRKGTIACLTKQGGCSLVGRTHALQAWSHRFDSVRLQFKWSNLFCFALSLFLFFAFSNRVSYVKQLVCYATCFAVLPSCVLRSHSEARKKVVKQDLLHLSLQSCKARVSVWVV